MIFTPTSIDGAYIIEFEKRGDQRGFFARAFCAEEFAAHGLKSIFVQGNVSRSADQFTLRGMHLQAAPFGEAKVMRCTRGAIFDALVDMRPDSPTYLEWFGAELTADNHRMLYIPEGCSHGYQTLCDDAEVFYLVSAPYNPDSERGIRWDDPLIGIDWPEKTNAILSDKDRAWPLLQNESKQVNES